MVNEILGDEQQQLLMVVDGQPSRNNLQHLVEIDLGLRNERMVVDVGEEAHDELAVHAIGNTSMARDGVAKVLDLERALETRSKEATERRNERSERGPEEGVDLHGRHGDAEVRVGWEEQQLGRGPGLGDEHRVGLAVQTGKDVGAKVVGGADEEAGAHQDMGEEDAEENCHDPGAQETLDRLLGRQLDQLGAAKGDAADVGEDVVGDDEGRGEEEPD